MLLLFNYIYNYFQENYDEEKKQIQLEIENIKKNMENEEKNFLEKVRFIIKVIYSSFIIYEFRRKNLHKNLIKKTKNLSF